MEFSDIELGAQRAVMFVILRTIHESLIKQHEEKNTNFIITMDDIDIASIKYNDLYLGLSIVDKNKPLIELITKEDNDDGEKEYFLIFRILDKKLKKYSKIELLNEYIDLFENKIKFIINGLTLYLHSAKTGNMKDLDISTAESINMKLHFNAFLQETLFEIDILLGTHREMLKDKLNLFRLESDYLDFLKERRNDKNDQVYHMSQEHYDELIQHVLNLFKNNPIVNGL